jgi:glucose-1-phosphate adenylyltransferase
MAIINLNEIEEKIKELTHNRPIAGIPFAGRYRVIDFTLSNMVNSGISLISIFTKDKYRSLVDHIGPGKPWDLDRKRDGLFMLHPMIDYNNQVGRFGDIENFRNNLDFIIKAKQEYVLITRSYIIANVDFKEAFKFHVDRDADITIITKLVENGREATNYLGMDTVFVEDGLVKNIGKNLGNNDIFNMSMEMYIMKKDVLVRIITDAIEKGDSEHLKQAFYKSVKNYKIANYTYTGYISVINSTINYYRASMQLLNREKYMEVFENKVLTKIKDEPSTLYTQTSDVKNSLIANGCIIEGTVENSILFRGVHVKKGAVVRNSIIMQGTKIEENANVNFIISDKSAHISENKILMGDGGVPFVIGKSQRI